MFAAAYIFLVSGLFVFVLRYAPEPKINWDTDPFIGLFMLGCYLFGGAIGLMLPETAAHYFGIAWGDGALERAAKIFGAVGGFMIAVRGTVIWGVLFILGALGYGGLLLWDYIFQR